ncbi:FemAB family XrtA/PEP-CTERM system-associated protein [Acidovorax sp. SRB_24]|uniref:FemAB family XrtA/PEP-CTERM system-associated protein n=1 Tax=Acidovorax sp. SRB_24 TaxID=1962700 RepID=UPI00197C6952|nr:FemAB family XrtA/PEP-CTERM system-associated protein [Acidovorax sp. SRB_24]
MNQLSSTGPSSAELPPAESVSLSDQLARMRRQRKQLSRTIGAAKKSGENVEDLLEQCRLLSLQESNLIQRIQAATAPIASPPTPDRPAAAVDVAPCVQERNEPVTISLLDDAESPAWDTFVGRRPEASSYHLIGWRHICFQAFGHASHYLVAKRGQGIVGVLPLVQLQSILFGNFLVSMPFLNYGGVLAEDDEVRAQLTAHAATLTRDLGCSHLELRERVPSASWPMRTEKVSMWLPLPGTEEALWSQIGSKRRAKIKKGQNHGLAFEVGGAELLDDFYRVFSTNMRDLGTPVYAKRFFELVLKEAPGRPELVVGRNTQGKAVAAALVLQHGERMEVPWASTLRAANSLNANMVLYWTMLRHACQIGCTTFDFGRSTADASTYRFKKEWGAQVVPLFWHYWMADGGAIPQINPGNPKYKLAIAAWKNLPVMLANRLGPHISRSIP